MLQIKTLGGLTLRKDGQPLVLSRRLEEALLVYLLLHPQPVPRATLIDLLWYDDDPKLAGNSFRATLSRLRKALGDYLIVTRQTVGFDFSQPHWHDVAALQDRLAESKQEGAGGEGLESALVLYSADFLAGFELRAAPQFEAWVLLQQERLRLQAHSGFDRVADHAFANGDYASALQFATRLAAIDPLNEAAHRLKMRLHLRNRERNAALRQFAICQQTLADELGVAPTAATITLHKQLQAATPDAHNLRPERGAFFGRIHLLQHLSATLGYKPQLLTLTGQGGVGKSRLAQTVARQLTGRLRDGVFFVSLLTVSANPSAIVQAICDAIGLPLGKATDPKQTLLAHLQHKELLLILDNFEHLLDAAALLTELLNGAPELRLLVTSRERLWLRAEQTVQLDGLAFPDDDTGTDYPAIHLLADRAGITLSACPKPDKMAATAPALAKLTALVEGLPLALEMLAGQLADQSPQAVAAQLDSHLSTLASRYRDTPVRHATMRAVFDYSWALLTDEAQQTLARLGVFSADFSSVTAQTICAATLQTLDQLRHKSLLTQTDDRRWRLHPLIREFAQANCTDFGRMQQAHATHYLQTVAQLKLPEQTKMLDLLTAERGNVQTAWRWASGHAAADLLDASHRQLFEFYTQRSRYLEGLALFEEAITQLADAAHAHLRGKLLLATGRLHIYLSQYDAAEYCLSSSLELVDAVEEQAAAEAYWGAVDYYRGRYDSAETHLTASLAKRRASGFALNLLANIRRRQGRHAEARDLFAETIAARQAEGDLIGEAMALNNLGIVDQAVGDYAAAKQHYEESGRLLAQLNNPQGVAATLTNAGSAALRMSAYAEARRLLNESIMHKRSLNNPRSLALSLCTLGEVAVSEHKLNEAKQLLHEGLTLAQAANAQPVILDLLLVYALLAQASGRHNEAAQRAQVVAELAETDELRRRAAALLDDLGVSQAGVISAELLPHLLTTLLHSE